MARVILGSKCIPDRMYIKNGKTKPIGGTYEKFCPLDVRILDWIRYADSGRVNKNWRWLNRKKYNERLSRQNRNIRNKFENIARDNYNMINNEMINPLFDEPTNWIAPDVQSASRDRVMMRSGDNARRARGEL